MTTRTTREALLIAGEVDALVVLCQDKNERYRRLQRLSDDRSLLLGRFGPAYRHIVHTPAQRGRSTHDR